MSTLSAEGSPRIRMVRDDRRRQLLDTAWMIAGEEGADALTLGRLAERAGVAKPVVYSHFRRRDDLLLALYLEFDADQNARLDAALDVAEATPLGRARALADSYVGCFLAEGRKMPGVSAALDGSVELSGAKAACERRYAGRFRSALEPFAASGFLSPAALRGIVGAADGLARAAASGEIAEADARAELARLIQDTVRRE